MDNRAEVREFLTTRRARVSPEQVGLPAGTNRRVEGLHRSEVATLAGVSIEYYTRIERGTISGASPEVLDSLAKALCLDNAERAHLFDLAHAASPVARPPRRRNPTTWVPHQSLQWTLDAITAGPAFVRNGRMDILAVNTLARAFYKDLYDMPGQPPNIARYTFLDDRAHDFYPDWDLFAEVTVATPRTRNSTTSSESSAPAAKSSAAGGARTTCVTTAPASRHSITRSSANLPWPTRGWRWQPNLA
jgi:transcriptional regulator with XRE-family HTH domain